MRTSVQNHSQRKLSKQQAQNIIAEYHKGKEFKALYDPISIGKIAEKFEVSPWTVVSIEKGFCTDPDKHRHKLTLDDTYLIADLIEEARGYRNEWKKRTITALAKKYRVRKSIISDIVHKRTYKDWTNLGAKSNG